jgi:uncharacterized protein involved in exopolysaccharide biosynthesis
MKPGPSLHTDPAPETAGPAPDAIGMLVLIWQKKWLVAGIILACLVAGIVFLNVTERTYTTELKVTAAASSPNSIGSRLGNLGGLAAAAGLSIGGSSKAEPFEMYLEALTSRDVADALAKDRRIMTTIFAREWSPATRQWQQPPASAVQVIKSAIGLADPPWRAPDGARLQNYLERRLVITKSVKSPVTIIGYDASDPAFGVHLLAQLNRAADAEVRQRALLQANDYKAYLASVLPGVAIADVRASLAASLTEQYEAIMMAQSSVPYAAVALGGPKASLAPTKPKVTIVLALAILIGIILAVFVAVVDLRGTFNRRVKSHERP